MIKVLLFASLRDAAGQSALKLKLKEGTTTAGVYSLLVDLFPMLERFRTVAAVALNEQYVDWDAEVRPGDEVAFFPPVSGGVS